MEKEKIRFITTSEMLELAMENKPELRYFLEDRDGKNKDAKDRKPGLIAAIKRTLIEHNLVVQKHKKAENEEKKKKEEKGYKVSEPIAKFVVENLLSSYFDRKIEEFKKSEEKKLENKFCLEDQKTNDELQVLHDIHQSDENHDKYTDELLNDSFSDKSKYVKCIENGTIFKDIQTLLNEIKNIINEMRKYEEYDIAARELNNSRNRMFNCIQENAGKYGVSIYRELYGYFDSLQRCIKKTEEMLQNGRAADDKTSGVERLPGILSEITEHMENMSKASRYKNEIRIMNGMIEDYDEYGMHKSTYEYHIEILCGNEESEEDTIGVPPEYIEKTVYQTMVRALFYKFYDFKEEEFRRDLVRRSMLVIPGEAWKYEDGFAALTHKLENPIGNYIFQKENSSEENLAPERASKKNN